MENAPQNPTTGGKTVDEVIELSYGFGTYSNTFEYSLLYSLRKKDFVRGYAHKGLHWSVDYKILPGRYVSIQTHGFKDNRGATLYASLVYITKDKIEPIETVSTEYIIPGKSDNIVIQSFLDARPSYHGKLIIPSLGGKGTGWEEIKLAVKKMKLELVDGFDEGEDDADN
ncbi:MAG: hypothetical protein QXV17_09675 [Candidatus Micrarchaeaceae archaeon]